MKTPAEYERDIADRDRMIAKLRDQLTAALAALAEKHADEIKAKRAA